VLLAGLAPAARAQRATVRGFVTDEADSQPLPGVNVLFEDAAGEVSGTATDLDGFYTMAGLRPGRYVVRASFVGYETAADTLDLAAGIRQHDVALRAETAELDEAVVESERTTGQANVTAGLQRIRAEDVMTVPAPDVSGDLANYLTTLPGVVTSGDRGGQLFIRGGEPTQNLVLLDGMPVYQPFHVLGFYSAFPTDILATADVYAGGYNARFGGQLSSVLDVTARNGNKRRFDASASVAPFVSGLALEGPLVRDQLSFLLTGRRSVIEQGAANFTDAPLPFDFGDLFGKLHYEPGPSSRLSVSGLYTFDRGTVGDPASLRPDEVRYENAAGGFRYLLLPAVAPLLGEIVLSYSALDTEIGPGAEADTSEAGLDRSSSIARFNSEFNLTYFLPRVDVRFGGFVRTATTESALGGLFQNVETARTNATEAGFYLEPEFKVGTVLRVSPGLRLTLSPSLGDQFLEPRFRAVFEAGPHRLSAAAGLYNQPIVGITDRRDATSIFTAWTTAPFGDVPRAVHVLGGYRLQPAPWLDLAVEGYWKDLENLSVPEWTAYPRLTTRLQPADGEAYGADARVELRLGGVYASVNYGYSSVEYAAEAARFGLWYGTETLRYRPAHDRRHQASVILQVPVYGFDVSARWQLGSGLPYSRALGFDVFILPDGDPDVAGEPGEPRVIYERPFNGLLPDYHRLDVSVERRFDLGPAALTAQAGVINAYDRANLFAYDIFTLRRVDQLPIIPTFGLKLETD
jgi:hypothetical protein